MEKAIGRIEKFQLHNGDWVTLHGCFYPDDNPLVALIDVYLDAAWVWPQSNHCGKIALTHHDDFDNGMCHLSSECVEEVKRIASNWADDVMQEVG